MKETQTKPGAAKHSATAAQASGTDAQTGTCVERETHIGSLAVTCAHYVQLGYSCAKLTTPEFLKEFDCHCSCPSAGGVATKAPKCNMQFVNTACGDASVVSPEHLCDNVSYGGVMGPVC